MSYLTTSADPAQPHRSVIIRFLSTGDPELNINPGASAVSFDITIPEISGTVFSHIVIPRISLVLVDPGIMSPENFGSIPALTDGLLIKTVVNGIESEITSLKDNLDILTCFTGGQGQSGLPGAGADFGLFDTADWIGGTMHFPLPLRLEPNDRLFFEVCDDLTGVQNIRAACLAQFVK